MRWFLVIALVACQGKTDPPPASGSGSAMTGSAGTNATDANATPDAATTTATEPALLISSDGVGPLTATSKVDVDAVEKLIPTLHWHTNLKVLEGDKISGTSSTVIRVIPGETGVKRIYVFAPGFATSKGIEVGKTMGDLTRAYPDTSCVLETGEIDELVCMVKSLQHVRFVANPPPGGEPGEQPAVAVAEVFIETIAWSVE